MENTSTKSYTSVIRSIANFKRLGKRTGQQQPYRRVLFVFLMVWSISLRSEAQVTLPALTNFSKPSPEPAAPGENFTPVMSGTAVSLAPQAAEWTRTAGPDESIVLTGVNLSRFTSTDEGKDSRFLVYDRNGAQKQARIQRVETDKAIITIPKDMASWSMYLVWPGNEAGYGTPITVNKTDAWWVGPDKATRGQTISVFGRNLAQNNDTLRSYVYIKPVGGAGQWASVKQVNPYKVDFIVPAGLGNGEYEIWTHNGHGGQYGWSGPQKLTIYNGPQWTTTVFNVKNYGATGNGFTNDTEAVKKAMTAAKKAANSTVYFPAGVYLLSNHLQAYSNMQLKGDGRDRTILKCATNYSSTAMGLIFGSVQNFGISEMGFDGNASFRGQLDKPIFLRGSSDIWISDVRFSFAGYNIMDIHNTRYVYVNRTEHIGMTTFIGDGSQIFIDRNSFKLTNDTDMALHSWSGVGISMTRSTCKDLDNTNPNSGTGWGKGRVFTGNGSWGSNRNTYLGNNITYDLTPRPAADVDQNSGEQFLWEGNLGQWSGFASASTATTTNLPGYSDTGENKVYAVIVKGRGIGQSRRVVINNGGTVTLNEPWNVIPDASSYIVIGHFIDRIAVYNNYLDGKPRAVSSPYHIAAAGIEPFGGALNFIAANNTLHELRQGVANWSTQHSTGLDPNFFSMYSNNKMVNCRWGIYNQLILTRPEGTAVMGTTYRQNIIQSAAVSGIHTSVSTDGDNSLDADIFEHNEISNVPQGLTSGVKGITNQFFYKNKFTAIGGSGITITPKMTLRENTYQGVSTLYKGGLMGTSIEAPLHVIDIAGTAGGGTATADFTLKNSTIQPMNWVATSSAAWLTFSAGSGTIPDEGCISLISLNANPAGLPTGTHTATITVTIGEQVKKYTVLLKLAAPQNGITIATPTANQEFSAAEPLNITANAADKDADITKVEFFHDSTKLGEDLTSPYSFNWAKAPAGNYALTAKATNSTGSVTTSAPVNITVTNNTAPTVSIISPAITSTFMAPAAITINATAADTDGTVTKVEFFNGAEKIGEDLTSPYTFNWYNVGIGSYVITARATDNVGTITCSAPVTLTSLLTTAPAVAITAPGNNTSIKAPTNVYISANAELTYSEIRKIEFFNGTTKLGEKTNAPFEIYWMNAPTGNYTITAKATGSTGIMTTSAPVNVTIVSSSTIINNAPTVSISSPLATSKFTAPATLLINANAADIDGTVSKVEFFYGTTKIGEDLSSPFSFSWNNVGAGSYSLTARATDNAGTTTTSAPVIVSVATPNTTTNTAPTISLTSPSATSDLTAPANVNITANAADTDGNVTKVEFFNGTTKLGEDLTSPYAYTWTNVPAGSYSITARVTDNTGANTISVPVIILVKSPVVVVVPVPPTVTITSPVTNAAFTAPAAITIIANATDSDGTITKVAFFNGTTKLAEVSTAPYSFTWNNAAAGNYTLTAVATDNAGLAATSAAVNIIVNAPAIPVAPTVAISSPTTGAAFTAPASITITANATDTDGTIAKVEFYQGNILLGTSTTSTTSPYSFTWSNVAAGSYNITANAIDNTGLTTTSALVKVNITAPVVPIAPTVALLSPLSGDGFTAPATVNITANATDADGTISKVEFFNGLTKIGEDLISPYALNWNNVLPGNYNLTAVATDNAGLVTTSAAVNINVIAPVVLVAPTVALTSPNAGSVFTAPANINITANAADIDGNVTKVEFFSGTTKLGEDTTAPYSFAWSNITSGTYILTAQATDNSGLVTTSAAINITAKALYAPLVAITSPNTTASFLALANITLTANASDTDGTVVKVEFYQGNIKIGEDFSSPYSYAWNNAPAGNYTLTAKATDNNSLSTTSVPVNITVKAPAPPTVILTSPTSSASFIAPASLTFTANATDSDGSVVKVEFYQGTTKVGEDFSSPYAFTWNNVPAGTYNLTAKAYDHTGLSATSASVLLTVAPRTPVFSSPTVVLTAPIANSKLSVPTNIYIAANATTDAGKISKVEFYNGTIKLGEKTWAPYEIYVINAAAGNYTITAKVITSLGTSAVSAPLNVTILNQNSNTNSAPSATLAASNSNNSFVAPANINLAANATDRDGKIVKVEFFNGNSKLGEDLTNPYSFTWSNVATGTYAITVKAIDNGGLTTTSNLLLLTVNAPVVNPVCNLSLTTTQEAAQGNGGNYNVNLTVSNGKAPYVYKWSNGANTEDLRVKAGTYTVVVTDANGCSANASVTINTMAYKAYPNPSTTYTNFEFGSKQNEAYSLDIYDTTGIKVKTLQKGTTKPNALVTVTWETNNTPKGVYYAKLTTKNNVETLKIIVN